MEKIEKIINSVFFQDCLEKNIIAENERAFCGHHFEHLLTTARLTYILLLEKGIPFISREMAYAAGLLHDIGRWHEYRTGADHAARSAELAEAILLEAGFTGAERLLIQKAIAQHRLKEGNPEHRSPLSKALARADSLARTCFRCSSSGQCNKFEQQPHRETLLY